MTVRRGAWRITAAPQFDDPDTTRAAAVLAPLLGLLTVALIFVAVLGTAVESIMNWQVVGVFGAAFVLAAMRWLVEIGRVREAAWVTAAVLHLISTSSLLNDHTPAAYPVSFAVAISVAGFTIRRPGAWIWGVLSASAIGSVAVLHHQGVIVLRRPPEAWAIDVVQVVGMLMLAGVVHWVNVALDRARAHAAEQEERSTTLAQSLFRAQRMEAIGRLAGGVAHDFNNLLTVVSANASFLIHAEGLSDEDREACAAIITAAGSGAQLTQQLLTFGGRHVARTQRLAPPDVIADFRSVLEHMAGSAELRFSFENDDCCIDVDPVRLQQAVSNLVVNASKAGPTVSRIEVTSQAVTLDEERVLPHATLGAGDYVVVRVHDDGCGMNAEVASKALEPFFTTRGRAEGSGLGLAVVHGVMKQASGDIEIESEPGRGTTISLWFPQAPGKPQWKPTTRPAVARKELAGIRILLVDDNEDGREAVARMLKAAGADVDGTSRGDTALELVTASAYDVAVVDVMMPEMSGPELVTEMHARAIPTATLFLTGYADPKALRTGIAATRPVLYKPVSSPDLVRAVLSVCRVVDDKLEASG